MTDTNLERLQEISQRLSDTEFELSQANALIAAIFNGADEAILAKDFDGIITAWNPAAVKLYGYEREEAVGKHISLIVPDDRLNELAMIMDNVHNGQPSLLETKRRCKNGKIIDVRLTVSPVTAANGKIVGASSIAHPLNWQWDDIHSEQL